MATEKQVWTAILSIPGIGKERFLLAQKWCELHQVNLEEWWNRSESITERGWGLNRGQKRRLAEFKRRFTLQSYSEWLAEKKIEVMCVLDKEYPFLLQECEQKPLLFFVKGPTNTWNAKPVAVVGTRKITGYGETVTRTLVRQLARVGTTIISGGMYGVDMVAHETALAAGGSTVVVLGFGFDYWYPEVDRKKGEKLLARGATLISEFPPFIPPIPGNFPSRNRIVAGMSLGVLVTEAGKKSGSHITAGWAADFGREVFAVPGPITNPYSEGTKNLINQGATLVTSVNDIFDQLGWGSSRVQRQAENFSSLSLCENEFEQRIYLELQAQSLGVDDLAQCLVCSIAQLTPTLTMMELRGAIKRQGNLWLIC